MKHDELLNKIKQSADEVSVPNSLKPERLMQSIDTKVPKRRREITSLFRKNALKYGSAAAAFVILMAVWQQNSSLMTSPMPEPGIIETVQEMTPETVPEVAPETVPEAAPETVPKAAPETVPEIGADTENPYAITSYDDIYAILQELSEERSTKETGSILDKAQAATGSSNGPGALPPEGALMESDSTAGADYSATNVQVDGVDEGDVVKTDGSFIYVLSAEKSLIRILSANGPDLQKLSVIELKGNLINAEALYIHDDRLSVIYTESQDSPSPKTDSGSDSIYCYAYPVRNKRNTVILTYDISDRKAPREVGRVTQDGILQTSRRSGDYLYTFTLYRSSLSTDRDHYKDYIPAINGELMPADCIYLPENARTNTLLVASAIDLKSPDEVTSQRSVMATGDIFYVSTDSIYIGTTKYDGRAAQYNYTELLKLSYQDGAITYNGHGLINGYLNNQFSMDEYKGNLRVVSTLSYNNGASVNALYILDPALKVIGSIEDLAPDEQIYSARFMGDTGYFVTFRNIDPLFSVDLKDPANPKILGELKITGFSSYLHPYGDGLMLGIGQEIDPKTSAFKGLKLSMFHTENPRDVTESHKLVLKDYQYTPAWYDHHTVTISPERNLFGFAIEGYTENSREWFSRYLLFTYDPDKGFIQKLDYDLGAAGSQIYSTRGLYINDWYYIIGTDNITVIDLKTYQKAADLAY